MGKNIIIKCLLPLSIGLGFVFNCGGKKDEEGTAAAPAPTTTGITINASAVTVTDNKGTLAPINAVDNETGGLKALIDSSKGIRLGVNDTIEVTYDLKDDDQDISKDDFGSGERYEFEIVISPAAKEVIPSAKVSMNTDGKVKLIAKATGVGAGPLRDANNKVNPNTVGFPVMVTLKIRDTNIQDPKLNTIAVDFWLYGGRV